jgi:hypothetical protein
MMQFYLTVLCVLLLFASGGAGETKDLQSLLPPPQDSWQPYDELMRYGVDDLYDFINGGAEVYLEYGFVRVISQEVTKGDDSIIFTIYEMRNPQAAFGIFSYNRTPQKQPVAIGDGGFKGGFQLAFWQDRYYVILESYTEGEEMEQAVSGFANRISENIGAHAEEPEVVRRLPSENLTDGSAKLLGGHLALGSLLFLGTPDLFALDNDDVVLYGEYGGSEEKTKLFLVIYSQREKAGRASARVGEIFASDEDYQSLSQPDLWTRQDRYIALGHRGNTVALVTEASSLETAQNILEQCLATK